MDADDVRPDPDKLLQAIQQSEEVSGKGTLKIFLGMAAGVGKTYAMLEAAQKLQCNGVHVLVGCIDTHGRKETAALLKGLTIVPMKQITYKGSTFSEMDLEAILKIKPQLVLVDELAHSNIPGSTHAKRWQDVVEILEKGIDVYTTLNVQHIESLKEFIESITGISIRETVPDSIIESATFIELIDLTPKELLERLKQGKVYLGDKSQIAALNFFQEDRLTALREIVLRYAAEKIDHDLHTMVSTAGRSTGWKHREKLLVAISHTLHSQKLIRTTRRLAFNLNAPWIALHVNDGSKLNAHEEEVLSKNLAMAHDLGAEVITVHSSNIAETIQRVARQHGVTQVVIGQMHKRSPFDFLFRKTLVDELTCDCIDFDLHIVKKTPGEETPDSWLMSLFQSVWNSLGLIIFLLGLLLVVTYTFLYRT